MGTDRADPTLTEDLWYRGSLNRALVEPEHGGPLVEAPAAPRKREP